jgi:hypothetical protein
MNSRSFRGRLNEAKNVAVRVSDVELDAIWHVAQRHGERNPGGCAGGCERLNVVHDHAGVDELGALEGGLIAGRGIGALEMKVAAVAAHAGVEILVAEVETEAQLFAVEGERFRSRTRKTGAM